MKKILIYIFVLGSFLSTYSCLEDLPSQASLNANSKLNTKDVDKLLTGLYNKVRNPSPYGYFNIMATEIMSDNYRPYKFQWVQVQYLHEHETPANDILLGYLYVGYYNAISRANTILKVPSVTDDQKGKAKFYRAYTYLTLYDLFESVPIIKELYNNEPIGPSPKEDVLNFIIEDLKSAKDLMKEFDTDDRAYSSKVPTKEAAAALLARAYRLKRDIESAAKEAEYVIKSNKFSISSDPKERTNEVITMLKGNKAEDVGQWGWIMSWDARNWNCFAASESLLGLISPQDTRRVLFDFDQKADRNGYVFSNKYKTNGDSDLLVVRIPEMYLISAEAGNTNRLKELQDIRHSKLGLKDERRLEMSFEWTRWEDMRLDGEKYVLPYPQDAMDSNPLLRRKKK